MAAGCSRVAVAVVFVLVVGSAADGWAQYRAPAPVPTPTPAPPQQPDNAEGTGDSSTQSPEGKGLARAVATVPRGSGWETGFTLDGAYEDNVGFLAPPGPNDQFGALSGSITHWRRTARSDINAGLNAAGYAYRELSNRNRFDWNTALRAGSRFTPRVAGSLDARFASGHADTEDVLINAGVLLPPVATTSSGVNATLTRLLHRRTSLNLSGGWSQILFDSPLFVDTTDVTAEVGASWRAAARDTIGLRMQYRRWWDSLTTRENPGVGFVYSHDFGGGLSVGTVLGAARDRYVRVATGATPTGGGWSFDGSARLSGRVRRSTLSLDYQHGLRPTPGVGISEVSDVLSLGATIPIHLRYELLASGAGSYRRDPRPDSSQSYKNYDVYVGAASRLGRKVRLVAGYRFRARTTSVGASRAENNRFSLSLVWLSAGNRASGLAPR
jgi:hypothetical protein